MTVETINVHIVNTLAEAWVTGEPDDIVLLAAAEGDGFVGVSLGHGDHMFSQPLSREQALAVAFNEIHKWNQYVDDQQGPDIVLGLLP